MQKSETTKIYPSSLKWTMQRTINEGVKRAIRERLKLFLMEEEKKLKFWRENVEHKQNKSRRAAVERRFNKISAALKITIHFLTPYYDRTEDEPTFVVKKKKLK